MMIAYWDNTWICMMPMTAAAARSMQCPFEAAMYCSAYLHIYICVAMYCSVFLSHADVISWFFSFHIFSGFVIMLWSVGLYPMILHIFLYSIVFCCWAGSSGITITYCYNMLPWTTVASHMSSWYVVMFQLVLGWSSWLAANSWCCTMLSHGLGRD